MQGPEQPESRGSVSTEVRVSGDSLCADCSYAVRCLTGTGFEEVGEDTDLGSCIGVAEVPAAEPGLSL